MTSQKNPKVKSDMFEKYLTEEVRSFITNNINKDPYKLLLQKSPFDYVPMKFIVQQIVGRKIATVKFPFLLDHPSFVYPPKVSLEQASSERLARYKAGLIEGDSFADLTGGMGIDSYILGRKFQKCHYVEPNTKLYESTMQNFHILGYTQCEGTNDTAEFFLTNNTQRYDWVYIDPSRRVEGNRKTGITNYQPNIVELKDELLNAGKKIMIKLSPMQDISECISVLKYVEKIWVISIKNDVKELLLQLDQDQNDNPLMTIVDLSNKPKNYSSAYLDRSVDITYSTTKKYIYQPAAALVKSELHNHHAHSIGLQKLHPNTQLFTSDELVESYFGRIFLVKNLIPSNKKEIKKYLPDMKANVITKNYPMNPQKLISKLKIKEGGNEYLIAYTDTSENKVLASCERFPF